MQGNFMHGQHNIFYTKQWHGVFANGRITGRRGPGANTPCHLDLNKVDSIYLILYDSDTKIKEDEACDGLVSYLSALHLL